MPFTSHFPHKLLTLSVEDQWSDRTSIRTALRGALVPPASCLGFNSERRLLFLKVCILNLRSLNQEVKIIRLVQHTVIDHAYRKSRFLKKILIIVSTYVI